MRVLSPIPSPWAALKRSSAIQPKGAIVLWAGMRPTGCGLVPLLSGKLGIKESPHRCWVFKRWVRSVRVGVNGRERRLKCRLWATNLFNKNKTNKQKLPRRGKTSWLASRQGQGLDRAGQGWTRLDTDDIKHKVTNPHGTANTRRL